MDELDRYARLIEERRSRTPFREFVKEIASWTAIGIYRTQGKVSKYPASDRIGQLTESGTVFDASLAEACARDYDHAESFFGNLAKLFREVPLQPTMQFGSNENTEFSDSVFGAKDVYLSFVAGMEASEIAYSAFAYLRVDRVFGSFFVTQDCSNVYSSAGVSKSFEIFYSRYISGCSDMWFCSNCTGCSSCLLCDGLTNQRYCIENVAYDRGTYEAKRREILADKASFAGRYREICRTARGANVASERVKWSYLRECSDVENGGWTVGLGHGRNVLLVNGGDSWCQRFADATDAGVNSSDFYAVNAAGEGSSRIYCSTQINRSSNIYYSSFLDSCSFCLGCVGLKNKSYCLLNKQYSKEEWTALAARIFASMEADGTLGRFFPASMNPYYFNDTLAAMVFDDFDRDEITAEGFLWRDAPVRADIPEGAEVVETADLGRYQGYSPSGEWRIDPAVMRLVIRDERGNIYRIVPMEYEFLARYALPLPDTHWLDRIKTGFRI